MRLLLLLIPLMMLFGCGRVVIEWDGQPEPKASPEPLTESQVEVEVHVLAFTAKWCAACRRDKPQIEELRRQGVKITIIDADEQPQLLKEYRIKSLPTYIVYEDGVEIKRTGSIMLVVTIIAKILKIVIPILLPLLL